MTASPRQEGGFILHAALFVAMVLSALLTVASRTWMLEAHRELQRAELTLRTLEDKEKALRVEMMTRADLNGIERRAVEELGMTWPQPQQWFLVPP